MAGDFERSTAPIDKQISESENETEGSSCCRVDVKLDEVGCRNINTAEKLSFTSRSNSALCCPKVIESQLAELRPGFWHPDSIIAVYIPTSFAFLALIIERCVGKSNVFQENFRPDFLISTHA